MFAGEGDVMEEHERDKVEQNALQVCMLDKIKALLCTLHQTLYAPNALQVCM